MSAPGDINAGETDTADSSVVRLLDREKPSPVSDSRPPDREPFERRRDRNFAAPI